MTRHDFRIGSLIWALIFAAVTISWFGLAYGWLRWEELSYAAPISIIAVGIITIGITLWKGKSDD